MTEKQLHHEVNTYEGFLDFVSPVDEIGAQKELDYIENIEKEVKRELKGGE